MEETLYNRGLHLVRDDLGKNRTTCHGGVPWGAGCALGRFKRVALVEFLTQLWAGNIIRVPL